MDRVVRLVGLSAGVLVAAGTAAATSHRGIFWASLLLAAAAAVALWRVAREPRT